MQGCFLCHQDYITCLHETCPNCELLLPQNQSSQVQDDVPTIHPETENLTNPPLAFESDTPVVLEQHTDLVASVSFNNSPIDQAQTPTIPQFRRREWTDAENREFERWITSNPKPTRHDKYEFAAANLNLTFQQIQNKINNWRSGRNIQRQRISLGADDLGARAPQASYTKSAKLNEAELDAVGALRTNHAFVLGSEETSASKGNGYNDFEAMSFENLASKEDHSPAPSITPSIIRYLDSTELEADRDAIQGAVQRASPEDLSSRWRTSDLLSQSLSNQYQWWNAMVKDMPKACARCEKENLECDGALPCRGCQEAKDLVEECSYHLLPAQDHDQTYDAVQFESPRVKNRHTGPSVSVSSRKMRKCNYYPTPIYPVAYDNAQPLVSASRKPSSVAASVAGSARSSYSGRSSLSVRYQTKFQRRHSANCRRLSATESQIPSKGADPPSRQASRRSLPTIGSIFQKTSRSRRMPPADNSRTEYFRCPTITCTEIFWNRKDLQKHEASNHFDCFCTFCKVAFRDQMLWRSHEKIHIQNNKHLELLWCCGICEDYGLSEPRRYLHIRKHWQEGYDIRAWANDPIVMLLNKEQLDSLDGLTDEQFVAKAERLVKQIWRPPSSKPSSEERSGKKLVRLSERIGYPEELDQVESTPMAYGFFASLRQIFPAFRNRHK